MWDNSFGYTLAKARQLFFFGKFLFFSFWNKKRSVIWKVVFFGVSFLQRSFVESFGCFWSLPFSIVCAFRLRKKKRSKWWAVEVVRGKKINDDGVEGVSQAFWGWPSDIFCARSDSSSGASTGFSPGAATLQTTSSTGFGWLDL